MLVEKRRMLNSARITCDFLGLNPGDTALLCLPLDYIAGKMVVVRSIERSLNLVEVKPSNHPLALTGNKETDDVLERGVTFAAMIPSQVFSTLQVPEERDRLLRIKCLIIGGGAITPELQQALNELTCYTSSRHRTTSSAQPAPSPQGVGGGAIFSTYGMTETLSHIALRPLNGEAATDWYTAFDSVTVTLDTDGCLTIDAPLVHDGILHTNDIAELHPDGRRFRIIGRKNNVICCGGIKLQIEKIEDALRPYIPHTFCITKRPDQKFGEVPVMLIAAPTSHTQHPTTNTQQPTEDITSAINEHLDRYARPKAIIYVEDIPLTETGKISRKAAAILATT